MSNHEPNIRHNLSLNYDCAGFVHSLPPSIPISAMLRAIMLITIRKHQHLMPLFRQYDPTALMQSARGNQYPKLVVLHAEDSYAFQQLALEHLEWAVNLKQYDRGRTVNRGISLLAVTAITFFLDHEDPWLKAAWEMASNPRTARIQKRGVRPETARKQQQMQVDTYAAYRAKRDSARRAEQQGAQHDISEKEFFGLIKQGLEDAKRDEQQGGGAEALEGLDPDAILSAVPDEPSTETSTGEPGKDEDNGTDGRQHG